MKVWYNNVYLIKMLWNPIFLKNSIQTHNTSIAWIPPLLLLHLANEIIYYPVNSVNCLAVDTRRLFCPLRSFYTILSNCSCINYHQILLCVMLHWVFVGKYEFLHSIFYIKYRVVHVIVLCHDWLISIWLK